MIVQAIYSQAKRHPKRSTENGLLRAMLQKLSSCRGSAKASMNISAELLRAAKMGEVAKKCFLSA
jgi:hypothetical protein